MRVPGCDFGRPVMVERARESGRSCWALNDALRVPCARESTLILKIAAGSRHTLVREWTAADGHRPPFGGKVLVFFS